MQIVKKIFFFVIIVVLLIAVALAAYVFYLQDGYFRYEDNLPLAIDNQMSKLITKDGKYSALIYNVGFGAYDQDYSFFMDTGVMKNGEKVKGKYGQGRSYSDVDFNITNSALEAEKQNADFYMFQEVDIKATRSFGINEKEKIEASLSEYSSVYASNFHSRFLFYPLTNPHGSVEAGLLTLGKYEIASATRKSYTVDEGFLIKFFDLDRCFSVERYKIEDAENEFVLVNHHMSAYDEGGLIRKKQMQELFDFADEEYKKGNYIVIGGDFNHALSGSENLYKTEQEFPNWVSVFPEDELPEGFSVVKPDNFGDVATCRTADIPYEKGVNYETIVDGFIISDNISASSTIIDLEYLYSDHNPVLLNFEFK